MKRKKIKMNKKREKERERGKERDRTMKMLPELQKMTKSKMIEKKK